MNPSLANAYRVCTGEFVMGFGRAVRLGLCFGLLVVLGCGSDEGDDDPPCSADAECGGNGRVCFRSQCLQGCDDVSDCPNGLTCSEGACVRIESQACDNAQDCRAPSPTCETMAGAECINGTCRYQPLSCESPPRPLCRDNDSTFVSYAREGQCDSNTGECQYTEIESSCPNCAEVCLSSCRDDSECSSECRRPGTCVNNIPGEPARCVPGDPIVDGSECNDEDPCSTGDQCLAGTCVGEPIANGERCEDAPGLCDRGDCVGCARDSDCDDGSPCTVGSCEEDSCVQTPIAATPLTSCALDGGADGLCSEGACVECIDVTQCDDGNPCTLDTCEPDSTCSQVLAEDGISCGEVEGSTCVQGACVAPECIVAANCDDGNPCTDDICDDFSCSNPVLADQTSCSSDGGSRCVGGVCTEPECRTASECDDGQVCTVAQCVSFTCQYTEASDGSNCGGGNVCSDGDCVECITSANCGISTDCISFSCSSNRCQERVNEGFPCFTFDTCGECDAFGNCVPEDSGPGEIPICLQQ
ncbi:MAG: hypothetical protein AAF605_02615 [Myxococcota bacterium]